MKTKIIIIIGLLFLSSCKVNIKPNKKCYSVYYCIGYAKAMKDFTGKINISDLKKEYWETFYDLSEKEKVEQWNEFTTILIETLGEEK